MALKLGKCRLCLKLGDFFSIFTVDNALQLAEMAMECTRVKIYEGDGLPDKVCSECVQKLSSAYIFKQQCERADEELRRNYVPPPGFSISPPPPNRQSSDSAFSNNTDTSNATKANSFDNKTTPISRNRKRSVESDNASLGSHSNEYRTTSTKRVEELRRSQKRPRLQNHSDNNSQLDSDFECNTNSFTGETDSDEPLSRSIHKCKVCPKSYQSLKSLTMHMRIHSNSKKETLGRNAVVNIPSNENTSDANDVENKLGCGKCGKTFKLSIMLKRHHEVCSKSPPSTAKKELVVSLEPIDGMQDRKIECEICMSRFKTMDNLEKHMRVCHAAALYKQNQVSGRKTSVQCLYCPKSFEDYYPYTEHLNTCPKTDSSKPFQCSVCKFVTVKKNYFFLHLKKHFESRLLGQKMGETTQVHECRVCSKKLPTQDLLIAHLAEHVSGIDDDGGGGIEDSGGFDDGGVDDDDRASTIDDSASVQSVPVSNKTPGKPIKCEKCDKEFKYKKALETHELRCQGDRLSPIKLEPVEKTPTTSALEVSEPHLESDSSQEEGDDNTCDICEKQFSYRRLLLHHKKTKHNMSSGHKRAKIFLKDCNVRCLICDIEMKVSAINEHNQKHISVNIKPRNLYTCVDCGDKFKSCSALANHIKLIHRLKQPKVDANVNPADFCEVVVTKAEPLDWVQSHNDFGEVSANSENKPHVDLSGFTCPICSKKMPTLISLKRHVNWHSNVGNTLEKKYECFVCNEAFRFQCHYKLHMRVHYHDTNLDPKHLICPICNRQSKHLRAAQMHMNYHKQTRFQAKDYQCSICERVFQHRKVYLSHMAIHYKRGDGHHNTVVGTSTTPGDPNSFSCQQCGKVCDSESSLKHHLIWHKSKGFLYGARHECTLCDLKFTNKKTLELHIRSHFEDDDGPYKCAICGKGYTDEGYYQRHVKGHNFDHQSHKARIEKLRKGKVKCPICGRFYADLVKLIRHLRKTHPESKMIKPDPDAPPPTFFPCKLCAKVFYDERRFRAHEERHQRKPDFVRCKFRRCGKNFISLKSHRIHLKAHFNKKFFDDPLPCPQCDEKFIKGYDLHYHLRDVHQVTETWIADRTAASLDGPLREFQCSVCFKVLASKGNYERHLDYHNSLRCNYCFEYFSGAQFLEGHLAFSCEKRKLVGDTEVFPKRVKCEVCYKAFHVQVKLDCHLRTQHGVTVSREASSGSKETVCDYCFRVFENEYSLSTHKIYHRTVGYFGCIYCSKKFSTLTGYRKHKNHHYAQLNVDNPTKCEHCDETFVAFREMIYHMRDEHGDDKDWLVLPKESIEEKCPICNKIFFNLHRHLTYHEETRCKKCNEYFYSRVDLDNHLCEVESDDEIQLLPSGEVVHYEECRFCFKQITKKDSKKKHDLIHRGSGAISCRFCKLKFKTMDAFNIHSFSHRSRKYNKKPIKCRQCNERFVKYGPFMRHMKQVHKTAKKVHYRAVVMAEPCVVCGDDFPNLHNHYRAHLLNQCQQCRKYFTSAKLFARHACDKEDEDPSKVFTCDADLNYLIKTYVPKDEKDDEKFYGYTDDEDEIDLQPEPQAPEPQIIPDEDSQEEKPDTVMSFLHSPIISDVLSLYQKEDNKVEDDVVDLADDDDIDAGETVSVIVVIDDD